MRRTTLIDGETVAVAAAACPSFNVNSRQPVTVSAKGLAGAETVDLLILVAGAYQAVFASGSAVKVTPTNNPIVITMSGTYKVTKTITVAATTVDIVWAGV